MECTGHRDNWRCKLLLNTVSTQPYHCQQPSVTSSVNTGPVSCLCILSSVLWLLMETVGWLSIYICVSSVLPTLSVALVHYEWPVSNFNTQRFVNCITMQCSSVVSSFVTFCSVCLLADFLVVNLLLGDYGSAHFSNLYICYFVNIQGITRDLRLKLMVLINL